ncbi:hypothetical protein [Listeria floridensis]|uniref:hypothetical protein n=1 Tax=Listeria floridensis TaxID=1494962 RepID=UPI0004BB6FF9|nr:hypothetical protein [Listeria floridensis]
MLVIASAFTIWDTVFTLLIFAFVIGIPSGLLILIFYLLRKRKAEFDHKEKREEEF